jgi:beta-lactamase regulating signal transducer with metallopeptidase domain/Flp pilus assembly protein TadD
VSPKERRIVGALLNWKGVALIVWLNVMAGLLLRLAMAAHAARRLSRRTPASGDPLLLLECERALRALGIRQAVDVVVSPDVSIPMVTGALHPRVLLPAASRTWSRERLYAVLLHELCHVRRRDCLWLVVARTVAAVFWFHPLVWVLARHVRRDAERACDETVLALGIRGSDYAGHLVSIARAALTREPLAGPSLTFATRSTLERRVAAILSTRTPCAAMSRRALASLACVSLSLFVAIAATRPSPVVSAQMTPYERLALMGANADDGTLDVVDPAEMEKLATDDYRVQTQYDQQMRYELAVAYDDDPKSGEKQEVYLAQDSDRQSGRDWYAEAGDLYNRRRYARAAEAYEKAAEAGYRRATALYNAGCSHALADEKDRAIEVLREAFDEGFDRPDLFAADEDLNSLRDDARFQKLLDDVMKSDAAEYSRRAATKDFERLAKRSEVPEGEWNSVGIDLLRSGDYERAAEAFDREFKVSNDEDALYNMACARALGGQPDAALTLLEQSIKTGSVSADHMAEDPDLMTLHKNKHFDELVSLAEDLTLDPGWERGKGDWDWSDWRRHWKDRDDEEVWRKSIPRFAQVSKEHPEIGRAWFNLGYAQLKAEEPKDASDSFKKALDLGYQAPITMYNLACCAAQGGEIDAAFEWLERAEGAGFEVWNSARRDDDLDPLRSDPRFKEYTKRWKAETSYGRDHKYKYHYDDDDDDADKAD